MIKKYLLLGIIAIPSCLFAQNFTVINTFSMNNDVKLKNPEPVIGRVLYDFAYIPDTTKPDKPEKEILALDFSNDYSKFYSRTFNTSDSLMKAGIEKQLKDQVASGVGNINLKATVDLEGSPDVFLTDKKNETVSEMKSFVRNQYLIADGKHTIDWDIEDSTKTIGSYTCQKATGTSRGRQYEVWFTTDLPYSFGPRRLNGLPGLILEAHDVTNRIVYTFKQYTTVSGQEIGVPENAINATAKEFEDMRAAFRANPSAAINGSMPPAPPSGGGEVAVKVQSLTLDKRGPGGSKADKKVINFPIDLTKD